MKNIDQFRLFTKLYLNENQCFMINQRDRKIISNKRNKGENEDLKILSEVKFSNKKDKLFKYLQDKIENNEINVIDKLLVKYLPHNLKKEIEKSNIVDLARFDN